MAKRRKRVVWVYVVIAGGLLAFALHRFFLPNMSQVVADATSYIIYPMVRVQQVITAPIRNFFTKRYTIQELEKLCAQLHKENQDLRAQNIDLSSSLNYAADIGEVVDFKKRYTVTDATLGHILLKNISDHEHYVLIDRGAHHGIKPDMVAVYKNCLVGRVVQVYPLYSKLLLVTDKRCKVAAYCTKTKAGGIYEGCNTVAHAALERVSHLNKVREGDIVLSSGEGLVFPRGFALGKIQVCAISGLFHEVKLKPLVDVQKLAYCYLIQKGMQ